MPLIRPFAGLRPAPAHATEVLAPPYDVLSSAEARERAAGKPWSFLHVSKPEIDLPPGTNPYDPAVYAKAAENLKRMIDQGIVRRDERPCYYLYRLVMGEHTQTGLVAVASVEAYDSDRIRKHEYTRPDKEDDRVRQIDALNAQTGPVFLAYRRSQVVAQITEQVTAGAPEVDVMADDGVRHSLWIVANPDQVQRLTQAFDSGGGADAIDTLYVADGHHRSAAASRIAAMRRAANPRHTGEESYNFFLSVIFPADQLQILDYNRVVKDLNGLSAEAFLTRLDENFSVEALPRQVKPAGPAEFGMYLDGQWYRLRVHQERVPRDNPVARLDVSLLADFLIAPVLGISDPRRDARIDFVGGIRGLGELERRVDSGEMAVAFSLYPTSMTDLMAVADAGEVMPPKSTWFEPKLADGLVSHVLD